MNYNTNGYNFKGLALVCRSIFEDVVYLDGFHNAHFIGIGGISMSGLAETLHNKGFAVTGSDSRESDITARLRARGIRVFIGHCAKNVPRETELVVFTAAVKEDNEELLTARERNIPVIDRARLMGMVIDEYRYPICVAGTHGKTTTTSMLADIFLTAGKDPAINLGGILPSINSNYRTSDGDYFIAEACEYFDSFLRFNPYVGVILNVEEDHLDYFKDIDHIADSFAGFARNVRKGGALVINADTLARFGDITKGFEREIITFGAPEADFYAPDVQGSGSTFSVTRRGEPFCEITTGLLGRHNVLNALAAIAAADYCGVPADDIRRALATFTGARRRFEHKGVANGVTIIDDYAHHPTEIMATLRAAKAVKRGRLICAFQPHTYTRTKYLKRQLIEAFDDADAVVLLDIYSAREKDTGEIHSRDIVKSLENRGVNAYYCASFKEAEKFLLSICIPGDMLITMGAGDVYLIGENILRTDLSQLSTGA
jgi:UDP-N-acetylmuramate--alanine ligase